MVRFKEIFYSDITIPGDKGALAKQIFCLKDELKRLGITFIAIILMSSLLTGCANDNTAQELPDNIVTADELVWQGIKPGYTTVEEMIALLGEADFISETEYLRIYEYNSGWQCITSADDPQLIRTIMIGLDEGNAISPVPRDSKIGDSLDEGNYIPSVSRDIKIGDSFDEVLSKFPHDEQETIYDGMITLYYGNVDSEGESGMVIRNMKNDEEIKVLQYSADNSILMIVFDEQDQVETILISHINNSSSQPVKNSEVRMPHEGLYKIQGEVSFREGVSAEGAALLTNSDLEGFYTTADKETNRYDIVFVFTESGSESFADITDRLMGETVSIWVENELLSSPRIHGTITGGEATISGSDIDEQSLKIWTDKLLGK